LDIEGLDWIVVREIVSFYKLYYTELNEGWPCVIFFEYDLTTFVEKQYVHKDSDLRASWYEDHNKVMQPLKDVGYKLLHEQVGVFKFDLYARGLFVHNSVALNCACPTKRIIEGLVMLDSLREYDFQAIQLEQVCKT
jgi:hypothetical protein